MPLIAETASSLRTLHRLPHVRPAQAADLETMFQCFQTTMRSHIELAFGWDEQFQRRGFMSKSLSAECTVFSLESTFAGFAWLERKDDWFLRLICIQPEFQGHGIGSSWVRSLRDEAIRVGQRLRLKVFKTNPSKQLHERLGFILAWEDQQTFELVFDGGRHAVGRNAP